MSVMAILRQPSHRALNLFNPTCLLNHEFLHFIDF